VRNEPLLAEVVDTCDVVYHLAASVGVKLIVDSPISTIENNLGGTETVLRCAAKKKKKVLLASTSEVYGKSTRIPFTETDDLLLGPSSKGRWSYACTKLTDEFLTLAYWKERATPVVIARLFNTVGPRQSGQYGMVIPRFVGQALAGKPITVYNDGEMVRCFSHVKDVVVALANLMDSSATVGEIYNVGNPAPVTIKRLARLVVEMTNSQSPIEHVPYDRAYGEGFEDIRARVPNIGKLVAATGWAATNTLNDILRDVISSVTPD